VLQPDEEAVQIVCAGLLDLTGLDADVFQRQLLAGRERAGIQAERGEIHRQIFDGFLERQKHARFVELARPVDQELHRENRLAAAGASADERRPAARQPTSGDLVQPLNPRRGFGDGLNQGWACRGLRHVRNLRAGKQDPLVGQGRRTYLFMLSCDIRATPVWA